jgi:predicted amidophosphoribosyltransferase
MQPPAPAAPAPAGATPAATGAAAGPVCARCHTRLDRPSKFCPECGNSLA